MKKKFKIIITILLSLIFINNSNMILAKAGNGITFKDKNLLSTLCKYYDWNGAFTKEDASNLSMTKYSVLELENSKISDLEGLQYFNGLGNIFLGGNSLVNLKPLSKLNELVFLDISGNAEKGFKFENSLKNMGRIENLDSIILSSNGITNMEFLNNIGDIDEYKRIDMVNNKLMDISLLKNATSLYYLDLSNNLISDITPLKDLNKLTRYLDLRDNCIIDYRPIKPLLDEIFSDAGNETGLERYDYYTNPVNFEFNGKTIKFPYLTVYYKYQAYAEAVPLLKALGGSAEYDKKTGKLTCKYDGNVLIMKDFSKSCTLNGKKMSLDYPMRRMQYDLAYVPVKDICDILGLYYKVTKEREIINNDETSCYAPKYVKIIKAEKELG